ncbi:MAG TPA: patatin-like phospholipase family protein [Polyangiaceae bacterium]|jgi:NTE family protein|nr:patatin-like phospholipase family protein [Polyangiaceae bacterium]
MSPRSDVARPSPTLREVLSEGPFGLTMSSGFFGFFAHTGMLTALLDAGLTPVRVTGSSAGTLVGGLWAGGLDPAQARASLEGLTRDAFWDPAPGLGVLRGKKFRALLDSLLPSPGFRQTRVPFAVSVFDALARKTVVLEEGDLAPAIHASCAVPFMFHPVRIGGRLYVDGGVADRPGLAGMPGGGRVLYHHLASRSPWRGAASMGIPRRPGLFSLAIHGLPRPHPFDLSAGRAAIDQAYARTREALGKPVEDGAVHV